MGERSPKGSRTWQENEQSLNPKALHLNLTLVPITWPLSHLGLSSDGQCLFTAIVGTGAEGGSGRPGPQTWENSQDRMVGTGGEPRGGGKTNSHTASRLGLVLSSFFRTWTLPPLL